MRKDVKSFLLSFFALIFLALLTQSMYGVCLYAPGDASGDGKVNLSDVINLVNHIFKGAAAPNPMCKGDPNANGQVNLSDIIYEVNYIFKGGPAPLPSGDCCLGTNQAPVCDSMWADPNPVGLGQTTTLTCQATDADGDPLTYTWQVDAGTLSGSGPVVTWTTDGMCCPGEWTITCTVSDGKGGSITSAIQVFVI